MPLYHCVDTPSQLQHDSEVCLTHRRVNKRIAVFLTCVKISPFTLFYLQVNQAHHFWVPIVKRKCDFYLMASHNILPYVGSYCWMFDQSAMLFLQEMTDELYRHRSLSKAENNDGKCFCHFPSSCLESFSIDQHST